MAETIFPFPFIMMSFYKVRFLLSDLVAGVTMLIFHIPQGMTYGFLSGLEPINGLYASFIPPLIYLLFGTSRHISIGTFSIIAILISSTVNREVMLIKDLHGNGNNSTNNHNFSSYENLAETKLQISIATTLLAGIFQLGLGVLKFGKLMNYVSDSMISGFTCAAAFHVMFSQFSEILGYPIEIYSGVGELPYKLFLFASQIIGIKWITFSISIGCIVALFLFAEFVNPIFQRKFKFPLPFQFVFILIATVISYMTNISSNYSVKIVGHIPKGLPGLLVPNISIMPKVVTDSLILAIVGFIMDSALVKLYALKFSYKVNFNQELVGYGLANIVGSLFQCTISAGAMARTSVVVQAGMKSQVATIISCFFMFFVLMFVGPAFEYVPKCVLSAIIVVSLKGMIMQMTSLPSLYKVSRFDFYTWIITFLSTLLLNVPLGLCVGFAFSLLTIVIRLQTAKSEILGQLPNTNIYKNVKHFKDAIEISGVKIFRFEAPLYFANSEHFRSKLYKIFGNQLQITECEESLNESTISNEHKKDETVAIVLLDIIKTIVVDCSAINYIDNVGIRVLKSIYSDFKNHKITFLIASPNTRVRNMLEKCEFAKEELNKIMFVTIHDAILNNIGKHDKIMI
uniref:Slc26a-6 n=1 Tax=Schmidtea mediterranea TaxID=79327 RepID=A0A0H3YF71_SCHMD|nr:slc26a-6 [Schmidtea mediterranea]